MITPNEYMTWAQAVKDYPDHYVVFDGDAKLGWAQHPLEGTVIAVCSNEEIDNFRIKCIQEGRKIYFRRTKIKTPTGCYTNV